MLYRAIIKNCKEDRTVVTAVYKGCQWLGNSRALYEAGDIPELDEALICAMFDIPDNQREKMTFRELSEAVAEELLNDITEDEILLEPLAGGALRLDGEVYLTVFTTGGLVLIAEKDMRPFGKLEGDVLTLYERRTKQGRVYIAVKAGLLLAGVIFPARVIDKPLCAKLRRLAEEGVKAMEEPGEAAEE